MRAMGVEPIRYFYHRILNPARLPIPPRPRTKDIILEKRTNCLKKSEKETNLAIKSNKSMNNLIKFKINEKSASEC